MLFITIFLCVSMETSAAPWRLAEALDLPHWLHLSGSHRTRYESLDNQFRAGRSGGDQMIALRTIVLAELRGQQFRSGVEVIDSRAMLDDRGSPLSTTMINPAELLQGYLAWHRHDLLEQGDTSVLRGGRLTLDVGSRRLVARSLFRNTINTFTGVEWNWHRSGGRRLQAFYTLPVNRKPNDAEGLRNNDIEFDEEDTAVRFWGLLYDFGSLRADLHAEIYLLGLDENDSKGRQTRNREHYTPGFRIYRNKAPGALDYLLEAALQFGQVRGSTAPTDRLDLDHFAFFQHAELGYSFLRPWSPHLKLEFDYASGDDKPGDSESGQFDTLFGARRFEYGPTGIYGPFARRNLLSPALRLNLRPQPDIKLMLHYRGFWLADRNDAWTTSRVRDPSGNSGSFIGHQIETRLRYEVVPKNYRFEAGFALLFDGEFMRDAPNSPAAGDAFYAYTQVLLTF